MIAQVAAKSKRDLGGSLGQQGEEWAPVGGGPWRGEDNVCGYWRFSDAAAALAQTDPGNSWVSLPTGKQVI